MGELRLHFEALAVTSAQGQHLSVYSAEPGSAAADSLAMLRRLAEQTEQAAQAADPDGRVSPSDRNVPTVEGDARS